MAGRANHDRYVEEWHLIDFVGYRCEMVLLPPTHPPRKQLVPLAQRPKRAKRRYRHIKKRRR